MGSEMKEPIPSTFGRSPAAEPPTAAPCASIVLPKARNGTVTRTVGSGSFWPEATVNWIGLLRSEELRGLPGCWRGWKDRGNLEARRLAEHCDRSLGTSQAGERLARITEPEHGQQADDDDLPENGEAVNQERQSTAEKRSFGQVEPIHNYF